MKKMANQIKQKNDKIVLLTGVTSTLGQRIAHLLINNGYTVRAIIRDDLKSINIIKDIPNGVIPYRVDITIPDDMHKKDLVNACSGVDMVFHVAAAVYRENNSFDTIMDVNVVGTENLLTAIVEANPQKKDIHFIFASSMGVYGHKSSKGVITEDSPVNPDTPYGKSKYIAEQVIKSFADVHKNIHYTILRMGTLYGVGYEKPSFYKVFNMIKSGKMRYVGSESNHLTLLNVNDAADAFILASKNERSHNKFYIVTDGIAYTQKELFTLVANYFKVDAPNKSISPLVAKVFGGSKINKDELDFLMSNRIVNIKKVSSELGFVPKAKMSIDGINMIKSCNM